MFHLCILVVGCSSDDDGDFNLIQPSLIQQLRTILDQYPDDGQILKVKKAHTQAHSYIYKYLYVYIHIYVYVVTSFFPLIIFILLCFNVLSTVPRENRPADFLYMYIYMFLYIYIYIFRFLITCNV